MLYRDIAHHIEPFSLSILNK